MRKPSNARTVGVLYVMVGAAMLSLAAQAHAVGAADPAKELPVDPAACVTASQASDADKVLSECSALIDNPKATKTDRINALIAWASVLISRGQTDRAIADYDVVLQLDPTFADIFNARGELQRKRGDRPKALADFAAALKLNPTHASARSNYRSLAQEIERLGARMAVAGRPSFNCDTARRPVEKAICADPELADLDREISVVNGWVVREASKVDARAARLRQREQEAYLSRRNADFGRPGYDLKKAMRDRLQQLQGADGY